MALFKPVAPAMRPGEDPEAYLKRIAKTANQRMRKLEKVAGKEGYENVLKWAYGGAVHDIERLQGTTSGPYRFSGAKPKTTDKRAYQQNLRARINAIEKFLNAPTSTPTGIKETYKNRADTINEKYGTEMTWEEIGEFWNSEIARKLLEEYDSDTVMKTVATIHNLEPDDIKKIHDHRYKLVNDKVLNDKIRDILDEYDLTEVDWLFGDKEDQEVKKAIEKLNKRRKH